LETPRDNTVPPLEAILVITVTFFVSAFISAAIYLANQIEIAIVVGEALFLLVPLIYLLFKRVKIGSYVRTEVKPKFVLLGLGTGALLFLLNIVVSTALTNLLGTSEAVEQANRQILTTSGTSYGLIMVAASLFLAGICEEFALRGFLQNALTHRYSFLPAVLISALVFGLFHFDPQGVYIIAAFINGLLLGYIYHRGNYVSSAIAHSIMNLIVLLALIQGW